MTEQILPFITGVVTLVGMWAAGNHKSWSWALGLFNQILWVAFIVAFEAWGLLPLTAALVVVYSRNWVKWRREARAPEPTPEVVVFDYVEYLAEARQSTAPRSKGSQSPALLDNVIALQQQAQDDYLTARFLTENGAVEDAIGLQRDAAAGYAKARDLMAMRRALTGWQPLAIDGVHRCR